METGKNNNFPNVKPGDWIFIGNGHLKLPAVVCNIIERDLIPSEGDIEVVFVDSRDRPINEGVIWTGSTWELKGDGPNGGYAGLSDRFKKYIDILREGGYNLGKNKSMEKVSLVKKLEPFEKYVESGIVFTIVNIIFGFLIFAILFFIVGYFCKFIGFDWIDSLGNPLQINNFAVGMFVSFIFGLIFGFLKNRCKLDSEFFTVDYDKEFYIKKDEKTVAFLVGVIIVFIIGIVITAVSISSSNDNKKMCEKLMSENQGIVNQFDTLESDPNSAQFNNLWTQTENDNPQLLDCIYPDNNN